MHKLNGIPKSKSIFLTVNFQYDLKKTEQHWYYCHLDNLTFMFQRFFFMKSSLENLTWLYLLFSTRAPHRLNLLRFFRQNLSRPPAQAVAAASLQHCCQYTLATKGQFSLVREILRKEMQQIQSMRCSCAKQKVEPCQIFK